MDPFSLLVSNLNQMGFFGFLLPWVFVFAVVYGLLMKTKAFDNAKVTGVIALVVAFFTIGFGGPFMASFFVNLFGYAALIIAGILVIILFLAMSGGDPKKLFDNKGAILVLAAIGIVIFFVAMGGTMVFVSDAVVGIVFIIILMAIAVYFIAGK